jgi:hypothetical protein
MIWMDCLMGCLSWVIYDMTPAASHAQFLIIYGRGGMRVGHVRGVLRGSDYCMQVQAAHLGALGYPASWRYDFDILHFFAHIFAEPAWLAMGLS